MPSKQSTSPFCVSVSLVTPHACKQDPCGWPCLCLNQATGLAESRESGAPPPTAVAVRMQLPDLSNLTNLTALNLSDNRLTRVPPVLAKLKQLSYLDLSCNQELQVRMMHNILGSAAFKKQVCNLAWPAPESDETPGKDADASVMCSCLLRIKSAVLMWQCVLWMSIAIWSVHRMQSLCLSQPSLCWSHAMWLQDLCSSWPCILKRPIQLASLSHFQQMTG